MKNYTKLFIDGEWVSPVKGNTFETINPSNEKIITQVAAASFEDVDLAVRAARRAFEEGPWSTMSGADRATILRKIAAGIRDKQTELAELEVRDNGKPFPEAMWDIGDAAGCFEYYADLSEDLDGQSEKTIDLADARFTSVARKEPLGVAGAIIPWNYPLLMAAWKVAPALAAGCTMVLKPSELTPLTALELGSIASAAGLPRGVLNILTGLGAEAGAPLSEHPDIDKLAFTGSVPTGSRIMQAAARNIKNISLELGGKSPFVIFDDSDLVAAVEWIMFGIFWNQGQVCSATSRVLVQRNLYEPLLKRLKEESEKIKIGDGMDDGVLLGPLVSKGQYEKVLAAISRGREEGAQLISGGKPAFGKNRGYYIEPAIFADVPVNSSIWQDEIFGPVVCVRPFDTEDEAIVEANNSKFGLAAAVMSKDQARCDRVARRFRAGIVWVNCSQPTFTEAPWGGYKQSGIGRELGEWGLNNYLEVKQITQYRAEQSWAWYIK